MNSGFSGADVAQLRLLSSKLKTQSGKLSEIALSSSTALVAAEWTGNDIDAIRGNWNRKSLPALRGLANSLHEMGIELDRQAMEQERASGATAGTPASSIFERFQRAVEGVMLGLVGILAPSVLPKASPEPSAAPPASQPPAPAPQPAPTPSVNGPLQPVPTQAAFNSRGNDYADLSPGRVNGGQCTSWVAFRRHQLGLDYPPPGSGDGGQWAGHMKQQLSEPQAGAVGSFDNHTFIVESVTPGPPKSISISEMNNSYLGGEGKMNTDTYVYDESSGLWKSPNQRSAKQISFGT